MNSEFCHVLSAQMVRAILLHFISLLVSVMYREKHFRFTVLPTFLLLRKFAISVLWFYFFGFV